MEGQAGKVIISVKADGHIYVNVNIFDLKQRTDLVLILNRSAACYIWV